MHLIRLLSILILLGYSLFLAIFAKTGFPQGLNTGAALPFVTDQPVGEDGYYMMLAAWNLAEGRGLTANFNAIVTGIQPLMTLVLAGLAKLVQIAGGDKFVLARAMILFGGVNLAVFALTISHILRLTIKDRAQAELAATLAVIATCLSFYLFRTFTYGLETGLYLTLVAMLIAALLRQSEMKYFTWGQAISLGLLVGLCGLARIDFGILAAVAFGILFITRRLPFTTCLVSGLIALAVTAPWFLWVKSVSGTYMPTSGPAQAEMINAGSAPGRMEAMLAAVAQNMTPWWPLGGSAGLGLIALALLALILGMAKRAGQNAQPFILWSFVAAFALLPIIYVVFFWAGHFYARYTALIVIPALIFCCASASHLVLQRSGPAAAMFLAIALLINGEAMISAHHKGGISDGHAVAAGYVARELPREARVGAFQSGVVGFYNENVINLDGKVNQPALLALRDKRIEDYLDAEKIDYVIDWAGVIEGLMPRAYPNGDWVKCPKPVNNLETICVMRRGAKP